MPTLKYYAIFRSNLRFIFPARESYKSYNAKIPATRAKCFGLGSACALLGTGLFQCCQTAAASQCHARLVQRTAKRTRAGWFSCDCDARNRHRKKENKPVKIVKFDRIPHLYFCLKFCKFCD